MGRAAALMKSVARMIAQIAESHAHMMQLSIRDGDGHAQAEDAMRKPKRIEIAIAKKQRAGDKSPHQR